MLDSKFKAWLIEINTNPWIEESSKLLESYIPRMINDALKLTIDLRFTKNRYNDNDEEEFGSIVFPVKGYDDDDSIWLQILALND